VDNYCISYCIDKDNKIIYVSDEWLPFAEENKAGNLTPDAVLNKSIFDFINDIESLHIYKLLLDRTRAHQKPVEFSYRCDSPDKRRYMTMTIKPDEDDVISFKSCIVKEEVRKPVPILDVDAKRSNDMINICSWCKKIKVSDSRWVEIEEGIRELALFDTFPLPQLTHGMCSTCYEIARKKFSS
jgi:hypothetical protein